MKTCDRPSSQSGRLFPRTNWNTVAQAGDIDSAISQPAIDTLFATYWKPIQSYIRYLGRSAEDAEDLTQDFFHQLLSRRNLFREARQDKGRLRTYVCHAVKRLVIDDSRKRTRIKRGRDQEIRTLETVPELAAPEGTSPDQEFDRRWAAALIERTIAELKADYIAREKGELFAELHPFLGRKGKREPQQEAADRLGMTLDALRISLTRFRRQYGAEFRKQVSQTLSHPANKEEVDEEIRYLMTLHGS